MGRARMLCASPMSAASSGQARGRSLTRRSSALGQSIDGGPDRVDDCGLLSIDATALGRPVDSARYAALARATGIIGIFFVALLFGPIIALSTAGEPPLDATASEAAKYFDKIEATWAQLAIAVSTLGWIGSLWFFVAFGYLLRRVEGDPPWRSTIATLSGALLGRTDWWVSASQRPRCTAAGSAAMS